MRTLFEVNGKYASEMKKFGSRALYTEEIDKPTFDRLCEMLEAIDNLIMQSYKENPELMTQVEERIQSRRKSTGRKPKGYIQTHAEAKEASMLVG